MKNKRRSRGTEAVVAGITYTDWWFVADVRLGADVNAMAAAGAIGARRHC